MANADETTNKATISLDLPDPHGYLSHYGLQAAPFRTSADPRLLWLGKTRREILEKLTAAIRRGDGIVLLTGDIGTGKTSLANGVSDTLRGEGLVTGKVLTSGFETSEFFQAVAHAYAIKGSFQTKDSFVARFHQLLAKPGPNYRQALLIIDEAQSLGHDLLKEIRDLSTTETAQGVSLSILLVGQRELDATLAENQNTALRQLIITRCHLDPLTPDEVGEYIRYCLKVAGSENETFSSEAVREIAMLSRGGPGVINTICNLALVIGHGRKARTIDREIIEECRKRMGAPSHIVAKEIQPSVRPRPMARRAVEASARQRRGRRGAGRAAPVYVSLLAALAMTAVGYGLYTGFTRIRGDSARAAPLVTGGGKREPERAPNIAAPPATDVVDVTGSKTGSPDSPPQIGATPPRTERATPPSVSPAPPPPKPAPVARAKDVKPKDIPPRVNAAPVEVTVNPPARDTSGPPAAAAAPARDTSGQPAAAAAPTRGIQAPERQTDSPDPAGVIDWLLKEYSGPKQ